MPRATNAVARNHRRRRIFRKVKGYWGARSKLYRIAKGAVQRAERYAYIHRKTRKREFRALWITRINAAARQSGLSYSRFIAGLNKAGVVVDRKILAEAAVNEPDIFAAYVAKARTALGI